MVGVLQGAKFLSHFPASLISVISLRVIFGWGGAEKWGVVVGGVVGGVWGVVVCVGCRLPVSSVAILLEPFSGLTGYSVSWLSGNTL